MQPMIPVLLESKECVNLNHGKSGWVIMSWFWWSQTATEMAMACLGLTQFHVLYVCMWGSYGSKAIWHPVSFTGNMKLNPIPCSLPLDSHCPGSHDLLYHFSCSSQLYTYAFEMQILMFTRAASSVQFQGKEYHVTVYLNYVAIVTHKMQQSDPLKPHIQASWT